MENPYTCDKCDWRYVWTMGDRVKAATWHELAHLFEGRDKAANADESRNDRYNQAPVIAKK